MSDGLHVECARAMEMLPHFEESAWLAAHLEGCAECRAAAVRFSEIDRALTGWGERLAAENPARPGAREELAAQLRPLRKLRWMPAAAAVIAAALALAIVAPQKKTPAAGFVEIPYVPPLDPRENATIVRMDIRVATLITAGYRVK